MPGFNVGRIEAELSADFNRLGFQQFDRAIKEAERDAKNVRPAKLKGDVDQTGFRLFKRNLNQAERDSRSFSERHSKGMAVAKAGLIGLGAGAAGAAIGIKSVAKAAGDAEVSMAKVKLNVDNAGISFEKHEKQIDRVITAHSRLSGFDDEELAESLSNMVRTTGNLNEAFKLNALAADIARTKGTDLAGAQSLLARVYNGSFMGVKRLGIAIEPVTTAQDKLKASTDNATDSQKRAAIAADKTATSQKAIALLQKRFGGQAEAYGKTSQGAMARLKVAFENVQESLGKKLLPAITRGATKLANFIEEMSDGTGKGGRFADKVKEIAGGAADVAKTIGRAAGKVADFVGNNPEMAKAAGYVAGMAVSVKAIAALGKFTGLTALFRGAAGLGAKGGLGGVLAGSKPVPVFVTNPGGGGKPGTTPPPPPGGTPKPTPSAPRSVPRGSGLALTAAAVTGLVVDPNSKTGKFLNGPDINAALKPMPKIIDAVRQANEAMGKSFRNLNGPTAEAAGRVTALRSRLNGLTKGTDEYRTTARELRRAQGDLNDRLRDADGAGKKGKKGIDGMRDGALSGKNAFKRLFDEGGKLNRRLEDADGAGRKGARGVRSIGDGAASASGAVGSAASTIAANVNRLAEAVASKGVSFTPAVGTVGQGARLATGGWIGKRGQAGRDTVPAMLGIGEVVLNRHQQAAIESVLGHGAIDAVLSRVRRPHYLAEGGRVRDVSINGPAGGYRDTANGASRKMDRMAEAFAAKLAPRWSGGSTAAFTDKLIKAAGGGLSRGSGYRSPAENARVGGSPTSDHMNGSPANPGAWDVPVNSPSAIGSRLAELGRKAGVRQVLWEVPDHFDHVHLGYFSGGGKVTAGALKTASGFAGQAGAAAKGGASHFAGLGSFDTRIAQLDREYGQQERRLGRDDAADFVIEHPDGSTTIDQKAVDDRTGDLDKLSGIRRKIKKQIARYHQAVEKAEKVYREALRRINQALSAINGTPPKKGTRLRRIYNSRIAKYRERKGAYTDRIEELGQLGVQLFGPGRDGKGGDMFDVKLDLAELGKEIKSLDPTKMTFQGADDDGGGDSGGGDDGDGGSGSGDGGSGSGDGGGGADVSEEQTARIGQLEQILAVAQRTAEISNSAVAAFGSSGDIGSGFANALSAAGERPGSSSPWMTSSGAVASDGTEGGSGGVTIQINTLHPADPTTLMAIGEAATIGQSYQGSVEASRQVSGY